MDKDEIISTTVPSENIKCRTCKYKLPAVKIRGETYERYTYGTCAAFENKPSSVLWDNGDCELYQEE